MTCEEVRQLEQREDGDGRGQQGRRGGRPAPGAAPSDYEDIFSSLEDLDYDEDLEDEDVKKEKEEAIGGKLGFG